MSLQFETVGVVGTGAMGRGIAQIAAQAGSQVWLFDAGPGAAARAPGAAQIPKIGDSRSAQQS